jgi:hypothetical protein
MRFESFRLRYYRFLFRFLFIARYSDAANFTRMDRDRRLGSRELSLILNRSSTQLSVCPFRL